MRFQRHVVVAPVVFADPIQQKFEHRVLFMLGRILVRLPGASSTIAEADLLARLEKDQLRPVAQDRLYTMCIAAFDDPPGVAAAELFQIRENADRITRNRGPVRLPD
jgi:hypothetical protein